MIQTPTLQAAPAHGLCHAPVVGDVVRIRTRTYLVEQAVPSPTGTVVSGACLDDDAQGRPIEVIWELELNTEILNQEAWKSIGSKGFDPPRHFAAYMHTLRWNCVTATDPRLFQSPFRAGIRIDPYQLDPLRKALLLPRVNLFIADDVGLGKTIEAGLIASELLLRRRINDIIVSCPPSMMLQWKEELESRFGLTFEILDRLYIERIRRERGFGVNPWTTFPRFIVSHRLLIDETYAAPLRTHLGGGNGGFRPGSLLILDEAHHAAPSSGARYAIDSRITRAIRDLAPRFEHRLFLSATPHNGHSNSFSALLEILDGRRFCRGVKVLKSHLDNVMVRRLKEDIRQIAGGFPQRRVVQIDLGPDQVPSDAPELELSRLLDQYRTVRRRRVESQSKRKQAEAALLISGLQQRLLSSVEAFARTLRVHERTMQRIWNQSDAASTTGPATTTDPARPRSGSLSLLTQSPGSDDDTAELSTDELHALEDQEIERSTSDTAGDPAAADAQAERNLLNRMIDIAERTRGLPDARIRHLIQWIQQNMCPGVRLPGQPSPQPDAPWNPTRLLIFTEWEDTRRYLVRMLEAAIAGTELDQHRIEVFHGPTPPDKRDKIKRAFNTPPDKHPVRILVATDAAREGLNLQAHCHHLFHFDVPWNPGRLEQRNGRIDRKLQPAPEVFCHYFVYTARPEDRVLQVLVRKTQTIREELGSLSQVLEHRLAQALKGGIDHRTAAALADELESTDLDPDRRAATEEELDTTRQRREQLTEQVDQLARRVEESRKWLGLDPEALRDALSCSLEMLGADPLTSVDGFTDGPQQFTFPNLDTRQGGDPGWAATLDTLRAPPENNETGFQWRKQAPIRPVVFDAPPGVDDQVVQLHLHHRVVQRLLGRFLAQGFVHHDLSRACLAQSRDQVPRVVLLGRLALYGPGAARLHEQMLTVTARWSPADQRSGPLTPYARDAETRTIDLLEDSLLPQHRATPSEADADARLRSVSLDVQQLLPHLQERGQEALRIAAEALNQRGQTEAKQILQILEQQKQRVLTELGKSVEQQLTLFSTGEERRQYESNRRYWEQWVQNVDHDIDHEPQRIRNLYTVTSHRIEPVGIAYLCPAGE